jgi:signal transduction histidine kinase/CheY-like chemotaxis protein
MDSVTSQHSLERRIDHAALGIAFARLPLSLAFTLGVSGVFGMLLMPYFPRETLLGWMFAVQATSVARAALWYAHRRAAPGSEASGIWANRFFLGSVAAAAAWSLGALPLRPLGGHVEIAVLCVALLGVAAFAVSSMAAHFPSLAGFLVGCLGPFAAAMVLDDAPIVRVIGGLLATCIPAFGWIGWQSNRALRQLLRAEIELRQSVADMREARLAAEQASGAKSRFLATMSHEVRTPLNGILGLADLLERGSVDARQRRHLRLLRESGEGLREIVDHILDFSKIEADQMQIASQPLEPRRLAEDLVELWLPRARAAGLELRLVASPDLPWRVLGDPMRLRQVLDNFVGNALKFTERGSVELRVTPEERGAWVAGRPVRLRFAVRDTGIGIAPEALDRIFDAFTQADDSYSRRYGGSGLGLAISRRLVALMGGLIGVDSQPGEGSTFWVSLPMSVVAVNAPRAAAATGDDALADALLSAGTLPALQGRVLMVEDNPVNRTVCSAMLERFGVEYDEAEDGLRALERAVDGAYDLVLMDCQMPRLDGLEATRRLRARDARARDGTRLPIVALTANAFDEDRERAFAAGMDDFLAKPLRLAELHEALAQWLRPAAAEGAAAPIPRASAVPAPPAAIARSGPR